MIFAIAAALLCLSGADAFSVSSSVSRQSINSLRAAVDASPDPYANLLVTLNNNLNGVESPSAAASNTPPVIIVDTQQSLLDVITRVSDAANVAASAAAASSSKLGLPSAPTSHSISNAQAKLSILGINTETASSDPSQLSKALMDALDASINAADHAAASTTTLVDSLVHFNEVLSHSMSASIVNFHMIPPETAELATAKMNALVHNLSGMSLDWNDATLQSVLGHMDRQLDGWPEGSTGATLSMYTALAFLVGYSASQQNGTLYKSIGGKRIAAVSGCLSFIMPWCS